GKIGYIYARDGEPLPPTQTLGRVVPSNNFQDARTFLGEADGKTLGQRGRQRDILREGVYAINLALFVVITNDQVYGLSMRDRSEATMFAKWQNELKEVGGFNPVVIGVTVHAADPLHPDKMMDVDSIGIVTVHDGPSLPPGEIIATAVGT